jgi:hypothetical protein
MLYRLCIFAGASWLGGKAVYRRSSHVNLIFCRIGVLRMTRLEISTCFWLIGRIFIDRAKEAHNIPIPSPRWCFIGVDVHRTFDPIRRKLRWSSRRKFSDHSPGHTLSMRGFAHLVEIAPRWDSVVGHGVNCVLRRNRVTPDSWEFSGSKKLSVSVPR